MRNTTFLFSESVGLIQAVRVVLHMFVGNDAPHFVVAPSGVAQNKWNKDTRRNGHHAKRHFAGYRIPHG